MNKVAQTQAKASPIVKLSSLPAQSGLLQRKCACGGTPGVDGECAECREKRLSMQRRAATPSAPAPAVPPIVHDVLRSPGQPLDAGMRSFMEPRFGHDFGNVRVHTDAKAAESARAVNVLAYTVGRDVVFGAGQYQPEASEGRRLLAHELTHVMQQTGNIDRPRTNIVTRPNDAAELEANQVAEALMKASYPIGAALSRFPPAIARAEDKPAIDDVLAPLPPQTVAAWYARLAEFTKQGGAELSALLMQHWLDNRDPKAKFKIEAHPHILNSTPVAEGLLHHRRVYLTEEKAHFPDKSERFVGILPRLQGAKGFQKWDGASPLDLHYEGLTTSGSAIVAQLNYKMGRMSKSDADLFTSLHDFQLRTEVTVIGSPAPPDKLRIEFTSFIARALDRYDWDPKKHFTVPNPDFGSKQPGAVKPDTKEIKVYHSNAKRLEQAGLAAPYDLETEPWKVTDKKVVEPAIINPKKRI